MQSVRKIINAALLAPIMSLPKELQEGEVEVIVLPLSPKGKSVSSPIAAIQSDENQSEALRRFRAMRKQAEQKGFLSDDEINAEIRAVRAERAGQERLN